MKHYTFTVHLSGYGKDIEEAWEDARKTFADDPGDATDQPSEVEDAPWMVES